MFMMFDHPSGASASNGDGDVEMRRVDPSQKFTHKAEHQQHDEYDSDEEFDLHGPLLTSDDDGPGASGLVPSSSTSPRVRKLQPQVFKQRWVQLGYLSTLALLSDWICFSTASIPDVFEEAYPGRSSDGLIDKFLLINVLSCLAVTDVVARFGLQRCIKASSALMAVGAALRSGLGIVPILFEIFGERENFTFMDTKVFGVPLFGLPPYPVILVGTLMVGAAQPFFQCTPPMLSAQWFASNERATSTAIALNFNQVGIATAFLVGSKMADVLDGIRWYFALISLLCALASIGTFLHFQDLPLVPPSASEIEKLQKGQHHEPPFRVSVKAFFSTPGFCRTLVAFIFSIAVTNVGKTMLCIVHSCVSMYVYNVLNSIFFSSHSIAYYRINQQLALSSKKSWSGAESPIDGRWHGPVRGSSAPLFWGVFSSVNMLMEPRNTGKLRWYALHFR